MQGRICYGQSPMQTLAEMAEGNHDLPFIEMHQERILNLPLNTVSGRCGPSLPKCNPYSK